MWLNAQTFYGVCATIAQRWPWTTLAASLVLTAFAAYASTFLTINTSTDDIIAEDVQFRQTAKAYHRAFPSQGEPIIALIEESEGRSLRELTSRFAQRLGERTDVIRTVEIPGSAPYFRQNALMFLEPERLRTLTQRIESSAPLLAALIADPTLRGISNFVAQLGQFADQGREMPPEVGKLVGEMAETTAARSDGRNEVLPWSTVLGLELPDRATEGIVLIYPHLDDSTLDPAEPALQAVRAGFDEVVADSGASLRVTGAPALREQELESAFSGAIYASILSFALVALTLVIGIRSWRVIFALLATLIIGGVWTSGLAAIAVRELNLISLAFMVLFFGLGVDFGTHLALRQMELVARGSDTATAIRRAITGEGPAVMLSVVCASIGFLSFLPTDYRGLAQLGIISTLGMLVAAVITLILLPAVLTLMPPKVARSRRTGGWFADLIERHAVATLVLAAIVTFAAAALATRARIDVNPLNLQDPDAEAVRAYRDLAERPELSPYALNIAAPNLDAARELVPQLEKLPRVADVRTIDSLVPSDQEEKRALLSGIARIFASAPASPREPLDAETLHDAFARLRQVSVRLADAPETSAMSAPFEGLSTALDDFERRRGASEVALQELDAALTRPVADLTEMLQQAAQSAQQPITIDSIPQDLRREWLAPDGQARVRVLPARGVTETQDLTAFARRVQAVAPTATGLPVINTAAAEVVRRAFLEAIGITAVAIAAILAVLRRRLSDVILIMTPLALAAVWTVAGAVLLDLPFNFANVIVIPLLLGLGVASSIHVVVRAREIARRDADDDILETSTPRAVLLTDANTAVAFVTLAISSHRGLSSMGTLLALAIMLSLTASLAVLPAILALLKRRGAMQAR